MNKEKLARLLEGREYREETTDELENFAKQNGLVIIFGASDDLMEARGAVEDEFDCWNGGEFGVIKKGDSYEWEDDESGTDILLIAKEDSIQSCVIAPKNKIEAVWCPKEIECSWIYKTELPHSKFNIMEDGEVYCVGIVFDIKDLK